MAIFKEDTLIYCNVNTTVTIPYIIPGNFQTLQIIDCPILVAEYDILKDELTPYVDVQGSHVQVTEASSDSTYAYISLTIDTVGVYNITIGNGNTTTTYTIHVRPDNLFDLTMILHDISDEEILSRLEHGRTYTFEATLLVSGNDETKYHDYLRNFRIGVRNQFDYPDVDEYAEWSDQPELNVATPVTVEFTYDETQALIIFITGDYKEGGYPNDFKVQFKDLKIYESTSNPVSVQCNHITPIQNCITTDTYSAITLDEFTNSNSFILSKFHKPEDDLDEDEDITYGNNEEEAVSGICVKLEVIETGNLTLLATLRNEKSGIDQRSIILNPIETSETPVTITIGDSDDLWGFDAADIENIEDWELTLQILNNTSESDSITFNNVQLEYYTTGIEPNQFDYFIEENNLGYYGVFMQDCDIPTGLNTDVKQLEIEGSDVNVISRQNIREKIITLEFDVYDCDPVTSVKLMNKIARLIYNERDIKTDQPIPKTFSTSLYPGKEWEYVCIKEIESKLENGEIHAKAELLVPDGTYKSVEEITTGPIGYNQGLNKIQPEIVIGNLSSEEITLTEENTGQKFILRDLVYSKGDIITLDCANRTIIKSNPNTEDEIDLSNKCDMDNDWFTINKAYNFNAINCNLIKLTYFERG